MHGMNSKIGLVNKSLISFVLITLASLSLLQGEDVDTILAKARSHLAKDAVLDKVKSLEYEGVIFDGEGKRVGDLHLRFKKPSFQRLDVTQEDITEVTAVNQYEGYVQKFDVDGNSQDLRVLGSSEVKQLQLNAHENLSFFVGPKKRRNGIIELVETVELGGKQAHRIRFSYDREAFYYDRYFEVASGKLLSTWSGTYGLELREKGTLLEAGIKFPQEVATYKDGKLIRRVVFNKVVVNGEMDNSIFDFPAKY